MRRRLFWMVAILSSLLGCANDDNATDIEEQVSIGAPDVSHSSDLDQSVNQTTFSVWIPRADENGNGIHYKGEHEEMLTWGAKNFTIDQDGTFWIADTAGQQILHTDRKGEIIDVLDVSKDAVGAVMAAVNTNEIAVISVASQPPKALRYSRSGELLTSYDLPMEWQGSVTGIEISENGLITVQRDQGYRLHTITPYNDLDFDLTDESGYTWDLTRHSVYDGFLVRPVDQRNRVALRRFLTERDGITYIYAEEWRDDEYGQAVVDSTVRIFDGQAKQIAIARVNIRDRYTFVDLGGIQYDSQTGTVLAMMTKPDGLEIVPLKFVEKLDVLPDWGKLDEDDTIFLNKTSPSVTCTISGSTMINNIAVMAINAYSSSSTDKWSVYTNDSSCTTRTIPHYMLGEAFFGVPYSWGDCDNDSQFSTYMKTASSSNGYKAGDANGDYASPTSCSRGVDCSGLVSISWGRSCPSEKLNTTMIASSTYTTIDSGSWDMGEVYVKSGSHVVIYYEVYSGSTYRWYEATIDNSYDRALITTHPASYYSGYTHRRYIKQC
ncbi:MAG: hypothetical protein UU48_C0009G0016 [Candidatus Uhrbacteria bacterium GW2011_GWF2_41_16]|uniref:Uncharacterized protein n=2 Tax=Candidatus Uhriibacteriota TaxID=1752732 RepID=A0A0G0V9Z5_9BACT|nr:MAG: hypothetical protein UU35_C0011G0014 [Candidatus Uhrbacteria bacterium GW2011_GWC2_41_11]KKR97744.1 MAG: hypothetical protein UU48_C0009G0016 [Candidatus Uhrbacteria bacterium GW2011_GWF2_41_16]